MFDDDELVDELVVVELDDEDDEVEFSIFVIINLNEALVLLYEVDELELNEGLEMIEPQLLYVLNDDEV